MNAAATTSPSSSKCTECSGTGREVETTELVDEAGDFLREESKDFGPCEICSGTGRKARETAAQRRERLAREAAELAARRAQEVIDHQAKCQGRSCPAPPRFHA